MALPFLSSSRCVLLIGDETLCVYDLTARGAQLVDTVPWQADDFEATVKDLIRKECTGKSVLILNDMTDQHFKGGQRLPRVGPMDRANVLQRKLKMAFPNYPIRGALQMKRSKPGRGGADAGGDGQASPSRLYRALYLFAAVPMSEPVSKTIQAVKSSMSSVAGFALLPVEASDMVKALSDKLAGKQRQASRWVLFVGQHQSGDLRQVIIRDGQLAMTRMTSVSDSDDDPSVWAREVYQEIKATISYLSRFGYSAEETTDMIVVANKKPGEVLEKLLDIPCNYYSLTAPEAARMLGIKIGLQEDARYADPLHVAWSGRKTKFILPMQAKELAKVHRPRQAAAALIFLLVLGSAYLSWQLIGDAQRLMKAREDLGNQQRVLAQVDTEYNYEIERLESLGFDLRLMQGGINAYNMFEVEKIGLLPVVRNIGEALGSDMRIDDLSVRHGLSGGQGGQGRRNTGQSNAVARPVFDVRMTLTFPADVGAEYGINSINNFARRLRSALPEYRVNIDRQVASPEYSAAASGVAGDAAADRDDYVAVLSVRGPFEDD